jgi:SAM-dependent methyltransferase
MEAGEAGATGAAGARWLRGKRERWCDPEVARTYDERRFAGRLGCAKHRQDARVLLDLLKEVGGVESLLDLPTGTGRMLPELAAAGYRAFGADLSRPMLLRAAVRAPGRLAEAAAERLPFADGAFDAVVCVRFLFHLEDPGARRRVLTELARVARRALLGEVRWSATAKHRVRRLRGHRRLAPAYGREELRRELADLGLGLACVRPVSRLFSDKAFFAALRAPSG